MCLSQLFALKKKKKMGCSKQFPAVFIISFDRKEYASRKRIRASTFERVFDAPSLVLTYADAGEKKTPNRNLFFLYVCLHRRGLASLQKRPFLLFIGLLGRVLSLELLCDPRDAFLMK